VLAEFLINQISQNQRKRRLKIPEIVQDDHVGNIGKVLQINCESAQDEFDQADNDQTDLWAEQLALRKM
jgi:hypothetical protein